MKKIKYYYNTHTLRYEKLVTPLRVMLLRFFGFVAAALVTALILVSIAFRLIPSPQAKLAEAQYKKMKENYDVLSKQLQTAQQQMAALENRDNQVYRSIFAANPLPDTVRVKLIEQKNEAEKVAAMNDDKLGNELTKTLNNLSARIAFQFDSYAEVEELIKNQAEKLSSIP
ncbi:MAG: M23 family peptidase, partial [Ferruginibacter sp.]